ncbi:hypothetical protein D3C73_1428590 [compost metagenome]
MNPWLIQIIITFDFNPQLGTCNIKLNAASGPEQGKRAPVIRRSSVNFQMTNIGQIIYLEIFVILHDQILLGWCRLRLELYQSFGSLVIIKL